MKRTFFSFVVLLLISTISLAQKKIWTAQDKAYLLKQLTDTRNELLKTIAPLSEKQYFFKLDSASWSANEIVEHLSLIEEGYIREFWWALSQPTMPESYRDSTAGGDEKALAYATTPNKGEARGTNLPLQRYCTKDIGIKVFNFNRDQVIDFFNVNAGQDMRGYYVFRKNSKGVRDIRDLHQQALWLISHTTRHTNQLKRYLEDSRFVK